VEILHKLSQIQLSIQTTLKLRNNQLLKVLLIHRHREALILKVQILKDLQVMVLLLLWQLLEVI